MGNIRIRTTKMSDIEQLVKVERRSYNHRYAYWNSKNFTKYLRRKSTIALVACECDVVIGKAMGVLYKRNGDIRFDVYDVSVLPDYRGLWVGQRLLRTLERRAKKEGSVSSSLYVRYKNYKATCLYKKAGYVFNKYGNRWGLSRMVKHF